MNKVYRVVFNEVAGVWQVVSECARGRGKSRSSCVAPDAGPGGVSDQPSAWGLRPARLPLALAAIFVMAASVQPSRAQSVDGTGDLATGPNSGALVPIPPPVSLPAWTLGNDSLAVGHTGTGMLTLSDGGTVTNGSGFVGHSTGGKGTVTVTGAGSAWRNSSALYVGNSGNGTLNITDGGAVQAAAVNLASLGGSTAELHLVGNTSSGRGILTTAQIVKGAGNATLDLDGGILRASADSSDFLSGFGALTLGSGGVFFDTNSRAITVATSFSSAVGDSSGLTKDGAGTLSLTGASSFTGAINVSGGTLVLDHVTGGVIDAAGGTRTGEPVSMSISNGATVRTTQTGTLPMDVRVALGQTGTLAAATGTSVTLDSLVLAGNAVFGSATDMGTVKLTDINSSEVNEVSTLRVGGGTLTESSGSNSLDLFTGFTLSTTVDAGATLAFNTPRLQSIRKLQGAGTVTNLVGGQTLRLGGGDFAGTIAGAGQNLQVGTVSGFPGPTTLLLTGTNTYNGTTTVDAASTLQLGKGGTTGSINNTTSLLNNGALIANRSDTLTLAAPISGSGTLTQAGTGTTVLTGTNSYTGGTTVTGGRLQAGSAGALVQNTAYTVNGGTLDMNGHALTMSSLTGTGGTVQLGAARLTLNQATNSTFAGSIQGTGDLSKSGTGTLTLTGSNTYSGDTLVSAGGVTFAGTAASNTLGGALTVADGAALGIQTSNTVQVGGAVSLGNNATLSIASQGGVPSLDAGSMQIGTGVGFNLSGISSPSPVDQVLINTAGGITGDFSSVSVGGFAGVVDYLTLSTRKSGNGQQYLASYGLAWNANNNLAHGTFTLTNPSDQFDVGVALSDQAANAATGWNGQSLTKAGAGTLTLSGTNTYSGGTALKAGRLNLGHQQALGTGELAMDDGTTLGFTVNGLNIANNIRMTGNNDPVIDTGNFQQTLSGVISGGGFLSKEGSGTLTLTGANTYSGATLVNTGTLRAGAANTLSQASVHTVASGATLDLAGFNQRIAGMNNAGTVNLLGTTPGTQLTVTGPWVGTGGTLALGTALGDSTSTTDKLLLSGAAAVASGTTQVAITNLGGLGGQTTGLGIAVVGTQNGASIQGQAFSLAASVAAGAYEYRLNTTTEGAYLSSTADTPPTGPVDPTNPPGPTLYRAEVPLYAALPEQLRQANLGMLGTMHLRMGDAGVVKSSSPTQGWRQAWGRIVSVDREIQQGGTVSPNSQGRLTGFQAGTDLWADSQWRTGVYVGQLDGDMKVTGFARGITGYAAGSNDLRNQYLGAYLTYKTDTGLYVDGVVQAGRHRSRVGTSDGQSNQSRANSLLASVEVGQSLPLSSGWSIEPQLQLVQQRLNLDDAHITGATVQQDASSSLAVRAGVRIKGDITVSTGTLQPYARVNLWHTGSGTDNTRFIGPAASTDIQAGTGGTSTEAAVGANWQVTPAVAVYGELGQLWASGGRARTEGGPSASLGVRVRW